MYKDELQHLWNWLRGTVGPEIKKFFITLIWYHSLCISQECLLLLYVLDMLDRSSLRPRAGKIK